MKKQEDIRMPVGAMAHAMAMAREQNEGIGESCRRYRRWAAVRRCVAAVLLLTAAVLTAGSVTAAAASGPSAEGVLVTDDAVANVHQMLKRL